MCKTLVRAPPSELEGFAAAIRADCDAIEAAVGPHFPRSVSVTNARHVRQAIAGVAGGDLAFNPSKVAEWAARLLAPHLCGEEAFPPDAHWEAMHGPWDAFRFPRLVHEYACMAQLADAVAATSLA